jgi:transaldolase
VTRATQQLRERGQSLWLDFITRALLENGTLSRYISELGVSGLTSNPTIFQQAIAKSGSYDAAIRAGSPAARSAEDLIFELALQDVSAAADLLRPVHEATRARDGWVSLEVSPLLAQDTAATLAQARELSRRAGRPNLMIKIPGTQAGLAAVEQAVYAGVPVNVTLLFSAEHYLSAAEAYLRAVERRVADGLDPRVGSVASLFVSRWDTAVAAVAPPALQNRLGIAIATQAYRAYRELLAGARWAKLARAGALPQRLLWGSTGTKDPKAADTLYVDALVAPDTINTVPEATLLAFADHGSVTAVLPADGGDADEVVTGLRRAGVDDVELSARLQRQGTQSFADSWNSLVQAVTR